MANKIVIGTLLAFALAFFAIAQDAPKPAEAPKPTGPKISYALTQMVDSESYNGVMANSQISNDPTNAEYSRTNFKGQAEFDLGSGVKMAPWIQERFEVKIDPSNTPATGSSPRYRNRLYAGLNTTFALDPAFNLGINLEYRNANDLKFSTSTVTAPEDRFAPYLNFNGKIENFYYNLTTDLPMYFDMVGSNAKDDSWVEFEGSYIVGYKIPFDSLTALTFDANYYIDIYNIFYNTSGTTTNNAGFQAHKINSSELRVKAILSVGDFAPFVGFLMSGMTDSLDAITHNIVGGTFGADLKISANASFNVTADIGVDNGTTSAAATSNFTVLPLATAVQASIVIKG